LACAAVGLDPGDSLTVGTLSQPPWCGGWLALRLFGAVPCCLPGYPERLEVGHERVGCLDEQLVPGVAGELEPAAVALPDEPGLRVGPVGAALQPARGCDLDRDWGLQPPTGLVGQTARTVPEHQPGRASAQRDPDLDPQGRATSWP
jgi:hypothetical protein